MRVAVTPLLWLALATVAAWVIATWRRPKAWPVVVGLAVVVGVELVRETGLPARLETSKATGGTGQAIRLASAHGIPVYNLAREDHRALMLEAIHAHFRQ